MSYYTTVTVCPSCMSLQDNWIVPPKISTAIIVCANCMCSYGADSFTYQIKCG
jgi:hypothetical protein